MPARPRLRGGFVNRNYTFHYPGGKDLTLVTYAEPGANGRWEQFMIMPRVIGRSRAARRHETTIRRPGRLSRHLPFTEARVMAGLAAGSEKKRRRTWTSIIYSSRQQTERSRAECAPPRTSLVKSTSSSPTNMSG